MADDMRLPESVEGSAQPEAEADSSKIPQDELNRITDDLIAAFKSVFDPEIPVDIYELGLIYKVDIDDEDLGDLVAAAQVRAVPTYTFTKGGETVADNVQGADMEAIRDVLASQ